MDKTISILGCGWFGMALAKTLQADGYEVKGSTTTMSKFEQLQQTKIKPYLIDLEDVNSQLKSDFFDCDMLFICIPPRTNTSAIPYASKITQIAHSATGKAKHVILISSTGVFEEGSCIVTENVAPQTLSETGLALLTAENVLKQQHTFTCTIIRFAGLIGPERNLAKHFAGKKNIPNGLAPINLIHLNDCIGLCRAMIEQEAFGYVYHGVSPHHPTRKDFYSQACVASGFEKPSFIAEKLTWKQVDSVNVPQILGYNYVYNHWDKYLIELS